MLFVNHVYILGVICSLVAYLPDRHLVFVGDVDTQEQVEDSLLAWIDHYVIEVPLYTCHNFPKAKTFLFTHACVVSDGSTILDRNRVAHLVVHFKEAVEKLGLHLYLSFLKHSHADQLLQNGHIAN